MKFSKWNSQQGKSLICSLKYGLLKFWGSRKNYNDRQIWRNVILNLVLSEIIYHHFCGQSEFESAPRILKNVSEKSIKAVSMPLKFWCDRIKTTFWVASMAWFGRISTYLGSVAGLLPFPVISEIQMPTSQNGHAHTLKQFLGNNRQIVWVSLTILWDWRLKPFIIFATTFYHRWLKESLCNGTYICDGAFLCKKLTSFIPQLFLQKTP